MKRRFITTDSHGAYRALKQCLDLVKFDYEQDELYFLGDSVDGWSQSRESLDLLLSIKHLIYILGNHDDWVRQYYNGIIKEQDRKCWLEHGGIATQESYFNLAMDRDHLRLLERAHIYYLTGDNKLLVHAGVHPETPLEDHHPESFYWNRFFIQNAYHLAKQKTPVFYPEYEHIYLGHTPTTSFRGKDDNPLQLDFTQPMLLGNVWALDTGAAFSGRLTLMDMDTHEYVQSEVVRRLYPDEKGRNQFSWEEEEFLRQQGVL